MKLLLDTHIALWTLSKSTKLNKKVVTVLEDPTNEAFYSVASAWEVSIKSSVHPEKISMNGARFMEQCESIGLLQLPITRQHIETLDSLPFLDQPKHTDPFDRLLVSQAISDGMVFITQDSKLHSYDLITILNN